MNYQMLQQALGGQLGGGVMPGAQVCDASVLPLRAQAEEALFFNAREAHAVPALASPCALL